ncbi:hypothetical protein [Streptomyces sp. NPDC002913]
MAHELNIERALSGSGQARWAQSSVIRLAGRVLTGCYQPVGEVVQVQWFDGDEVPQLRGISRIRLPGEVGDLPCGDTVHPRIGVAETVQPFQTLGQVLEVRPGRALGGRLQPVEQRRPVAVALLQQPQTSAR